MKRDIVNVGKNGDTGTTDVVASQLTRVCCRNRQFEIELKQELVEIEKTPSVYPHRLIVGSDDIDEMNHVNNLRYLKWCLQAAGAHSKHVGWSSSRYKGTGYGFVVRAHEIKYRIPGLLGDEVVVNTWVSNMEKVSSERRYQIVRTVDGKRLAEAKTTWVFVNLKTLELAQIPDEIRAAFNLKSKI